MFNLKYGFVRGTPHSIQEIAKLTGYSVSGLTTIFEKGKGAYYSNPASVRPSVTSPEQWGMGRIYSAVMGGKASRIDKAHLIPQISMDTSDVVEEHKRLVKVLERGTVAERKREAQKQKKELKTYSSS